MAGITRGDVLRALDADLIITTEMPLIVLGGGGAEATVGGSTLTQAVWIYAVEPLQVINVGGGADHPLEFKLRGWSGSDLDVPFRFRPLYINTNDLRPPGFRFPEPLYYIDRDNTNSIHGFLQSLGPAGGILTVRFLVLYRPAVMVG